MTPSCLTLKTLSVAGLSFCILFYPEQARAVLREYFLTIAQQEVNITGEPARGMTINGGIPGPTLRFQEGDFARIHVHNQMKVETSIHWHGILLPNDMDGENSPNPRRGYGTLCLVLQQ